MLYDSLKIFHIVSASVLLTSAIYSGRRWIATRDSQPLHRQTVFLIIPFAIMQLLTGFTMISLKVNELSPWWISSILISFIIAIISWAGFIFYPRAQRVFLFLLSVSIITLLFLMTNRS